ncbi:hypothetical protein [Dokdonella sp.]|uniref:hypothetical protein n=1 Tax=Dokdonella sp. TaxID=2291710 RepID=UPI0031C4F277|nr:hypothetical protein [Dokdonella sp.]
MKSLIVIAALSVSACATFPDSYQPVPSDVTIGSPPQNPEAAVREHMEDVLRDPDSAKYKIESVIKAYAHEPLSHGGKFAWAGHRIDFSVNAKNGYGGYTGFKHYIGLYSDGRVSRVYEAGNSPWVFTTIPN